MRRILHKIGAVIGPLLTISSALGDQLPPGAARATGTIIGTVVTLLTSLERAYGHRDPQNR
jgi:hypothetical protein